MESYFDQAEWKRKIEKIEREGKAPEWLSQALRKMGDASSELPIAEDEARYVVEFIYPH